MIYKYNSIIGNIYISADDNNLLGLSYNIRNTPSQYRQNDIIRLTVEQLNEYFLGKRKIFNLPINIQGTEFQKTVWKELNKIPYGETRTYKEIAQFIGKENAQRAVGNANNKNPIAIIIPCHRVIGSNGTLTGYAGGINKKKFLLNLEKNFTKGIFFNLPAIIL